ncbi:hypothetical protein PSI22_18955 [Xenorhabdus sp. XENO-7]|uniref:Uncharacterized protein n=1 Tax=Xenorhabdus aichiensis TaxID=3025874 RepID=A0ABT5M814_9GAMM|nr:hypothetical protein [Xenorhabdus aichiensis]MDC9623657.1 hypothetical protein [Xenorhabdus aichiensis]
MMIIHIKEDGSTSVQTAGYTALYDKEGKPKVIIGKAPATLVIHNAFKQKAEKEQASKTYDAGMTLAVDTGEAKSASAILGEVGKALEGTWTGLISAGISDAKKGNDKHIRQIVREEIRQFVNRESRCGGLFSKW